MPSDGNLFICGMSDRDLAARLIRMGAIAPMNLDLITPEKIEDITTGLPSIYSCRYTVTDVNGAKLSFDCFDLTPEGLNRQILEKLAGRKITALPDRHVIPEYSPDAWKGFLQQDFDSIDRETLRKQFRRWGMPLESKKIRTGFCRNPALNERRAKEMLKANQTDLLSRLVRMGVIEPLDLEQVSISQADEMIRSLPALIESEIVWKGKEDFERKSFVNLAEFHIGKRGFFEPDSMEFEEGITDDELRVPLHEEERPAVYSGDGNLQGSNVRSGKHTLHLQEIRFLSAHKGLEDKMIHRREEISGGYTWLNYFRQGRNEALPDGSTTALRNAFKNWNIPLKRGNLELGFAKNAAVNKKEAMLAFYRVLIQKVVNAGIVEKIPRNDWYRLDLAKAEAFAAKIPLLPEQNHPGEWLEFFKQPPPASALEIVQLENRFREAEIDFDEELVCSSFLKPKEKQNPMKGIKTMQDITVDDYKKMIGRLTASGRMERIDGDEFKRLSLEDARDYVRGFDDPASGKQKMLLRSMKDEGRITVPEHEIDQLSKQEASFVVDHAPQQKISFEEPEHPMTDSTRRELRRLIDNEETPQMPWSRFNNLSEDEARQKIDMVYTRRPASDKQKKIISEALGQKTIPKKVISDFFKKPVVSPKDIDRLNQLQASRLIGSMPASDRQIESVKQLVEDQRIEALTSFDISAAEANKILEKAYRETPAERDPDSSATRKQKEALRQLMEEKQLPDGITSGMIDKMTFGEASEILQDAPASKAQKDMVVRLVREEKLPHIPRQELTGMTRNMATLLLDVGTGKRPQADLPKFEEIDYPASDSQMKVLIDLREKGKIQDFPESVTRNTARQIINDALAGELMAPQQMAIIEKKIANHLLPDLKPEDKAKLTKGDFARLMKESREKESMSKESPEGKGHAKDKPKSRENSGMVR